MKTITVRNKSLMNMIHKACPAGVEYASKVMDYAVELSDISESFYSDNLLNNYGMFPFLNRESLEYVENNVYSMPVAVSSKFDLNLYLEWVDELSLSNKEKEDLKNDVRGAYIHVDKLLDENYLLMLNYTINYLKCIKNRRSDRKDRLNEVLNLDLGYSAVITFNSVFTLEYLRRKTRKLNSKRVKTGRKYLILEYSGLSMSRVVIVSCIPYNQIICI